MESGMKITAGIGAADDYVRLVKAGADEVFAGFVPWEWNLRFGNVQPLNRREVLFYHVQIGSYQEMKILKKMRDTYKIPVSITFNALYYTEPQIKCILSMIRKLTEIGFYDFIICDAALLLAIKKEHVKCNIHISGEIGEWNHNTLKMFWDLLEKNEGREKSSVSLKRVIFHRKNTLKDMEAMIRYGKQEGMNLEYEAFFMNEKCHFTGGYCNSLHSDECIHLCQMPYQLSTVNELEKPDMTIEKWRQSFEGVDVRNQEEELEIPGETGCGLCALWKLREIGITHLKIVGRGKSPECMEKDVENVRMAMQILRNCRSESVYKKEMKSVLFPNGRCSKNCYYQEAAEEKQPDEKI